MIRPDAAIGVQATRVSSKSTRYNGSGLALWQYLLGAILFSLSCTDNARVSADHASGHVAHLVELAAADVSEVRSGLPAGTSHLASLWDGDSKAEDDPEAARDALQRARAKIQDLRVAKSTFFALALPNGRVIRNDQDQDLMAGKNFFESYPNLKKALSAGYAEDRGSMHEARGVEGKPDAQWVAAAAVKQDGKTRGLYVTGWSWAHYARRLEAGLQTHLRDLETDPKKKKPLIYAFIVVGKQAYGTRESPSVNAEAIEKLDLFTELEKGQPVRKELEITGRDFGLAAQKAPALGENVAIAVLRSET